MAERTTAYQRIPVTVELVSQATLAQDLAKGRYDLGLASIVEPTQAQLNLTQAQIENVGAQYDYQSAYAFLDTRSARCDRLRKSGRGLKNRGGALTAASFVFPAGTAGARRAARNRGVGRGGLGSFCRGGSGRMRVSGRSGGPDDLRHGVGAVEFLFDGEGRLHGFDAGESAELDGSNPGGRHSTRSWRSVWSRRSSAVARSIWRWASARARSMARWAGHWRDRAGCRIPFRIRGGTAAETPGGVDDFGGERLLQGAFGAERFLEAFAKERVDVGVFGGTKSPAE